MTYINTKAESAYLSLITDAYSQKIVSYNLDNGLHTSSVEAAIQMEVE